jgi:hypothetical protein
VLDSSGSIAQQVSELCSGVNDFIDEQRALMAECYLSMWTFDSSVKKLYEGLIEGAPILSPSRYPLGGYTALYDAIGAAIDKALAEPQNQHMIVVFTDGGENASKKYTFSAVTARIQEAIAAGLSVVYLGAGISAVQAAAQIGIPANSTLSVGSSGDSYSHALISSSAQLMAVRTGHSAVVAFSDADRKYQSTRGAS